ncbi:MAG: thiamine phosphate synthase, partial [Candidatus Puniceispirillum sp.]
VIGSDKVVGLSVETVEAAKQVSVGIVDYIGISPVYATPTKEDHKVPIGFDGLAKICAASPVHSVAVGGLKLADCHDVLAAGSNGMAVVSAMWLILAVIFALMAMVAIYDYWQKPRAVLGNYPLLGRFRFLLESIRPELRQYFWESDTDELPYSRNQRAMVYQRAKGIMAARPFGSDKDMYAEDFNWLNHSLQPSHIENSDFRTRVGVGDAAYDISVLNISGTSFGALSPPAIQSLSAGAKKGGFAHNTGEGSLSKYHVAGGGDT